MLIYRDMLTDEVLFDDAYPIKLVDDLYYRVTGKLTSESTDVNESVIAGNASAEGGWEAFEANVRKGVNIVLAYHLKEIEGLDRKEYITLFKQYARRLIRHYKKNLPDKVAELEDKIRMLLEEVEKLLKAEEFQFFQAVSDIGEGMVALLGYEEDVTTVSHRMCASRMNRISAESTLQKNNP
ncbi:translationally-controlled tumor protein homolog isoform X1 [Apostichopus japonicus]|uniref:translationally-controlled tumor protein homolog isoform X1 n=1 Tax=Stichopus japonicus TaxID=307972 RepID=UPI003AB7D5EA